MSCKEGAANPALVSGVALIVVGGLLLLNQLGYIHNWFNFWAVIFIVVGILNLAQSANMRAWGTLLVAAGVLIELNQLGVLNVELRTYWPLLVIAIGIVMIWRAYQPQEAEIADSPHLKLVAIWGGGEYRIHSKDFRGGDLIAFMGGFDVDLRNADIEGDQAVINVSALMGGGVIRVPETWAVSMRIAAFMGGHSLKAREGAQPNKRLIVKGLAVMGGVEVRN